MNSVSICIDICIHSKYPITEWLPHHHLLLLLPPYYPIIVIIKLFMK